MSRKAVPSSPEPAKLTKRRHAGTGIKGIFGGRRTKEQPTKPAASSPTESSQAIAAARAALASGNQAHSSQRNVKGVSSPNGITSSEAAMVTPIQPAQPESTEPSSNPISPALRISPALDERRGSAAAENHRRAPNAQHHEEEENLSRVDTNEREQADREFSTFDQGPLLEQPGFVPPDSPSVPEPEPVSPVEHEEPSQHFPGAFTPEIEREQTYGNDDGTSLTKQISPVQDRWAQIRKNAADRAARQSEEQSRQSEVKTDDGETSGEESKSWRIELHVLEGSMTRY
jgi:hypothetical protein